MRVIFTDRFDFVTLRAKNGKPRAMVAYQPGAEPLTVKREHGEAAVAAGVATEVKEPHKRVDGGAVKAKYDKRETGAETVAPAGPVSIDLIDPHE